MLTFAGIIASSLDTQPPLTRTAPSYALPDAASPSEPGSARSKAAPRYALLEQRVIGLLLAERPTGRLPRVMRAVPSPVAPSYAWPLPDVPPQDMREVAAASAPTYASAIGVPFPIRRGARNRTFTIKSADRQAPRSGHARQSCHRFLVCFGAIGRQHFLQRLPEAFDLVA